jgi:hypothetical protein
VIPVPPRRPPSIGDGETALRLAALPSKLTCDGPGASPILAKVKLGPRNLPAAGQMTEAMADAKHLYEAERWDEALKALVPAARGEAGDDLGNRQIAELRIAQALHHLKRFAESAAALRAIARQRDHIKHWEALLWLATLAADHPEYLELSDFAAYTSEDVRRYDGQRAVYHRLAFLLGRQRMAAGDTEEARDMFDRVPPEHPYAPHARKCLDMMRAQGR